jgi:hypothetical protein
MARARILDSLVLSQVSRCADVFGFVIVIVLFMIGFAGE